MIEEHAGAAVHLRNDDALGAVDDERAVLGHERHVAHVDVLFLDVADRARARILIDIPDHQSQGDLQRCGEGDAALLALVNIVFGLFKLVAHELELGAVREILDREDRLQDFLNADILARFRGNAHLQEKVIRTLLHLDEVRHRSNLGNPSEALADALATREGLCHACLSMLVRRVPPLRAAAPHS